MGRVSSRWRLSSSHASSPRRSLRRSPRPSARASRPTRPRSRFLTDRHLLLVLDNFEQLVDAAPLVGELLSACPELVVMITSREPTRLAAERLFAVRPLEVPDGSVRAPAIELERYAAVAMFIDRARARDPEFALDESNAPHVREICRRLDGLPLALELAAARVGLLTPPELATRLDDALGVLIGGARDAPDRQRTLRATIDWSYRLLDDAEREAFARMAVFPAGATVACRRARHRRLAGHPGLPGRQAVARASRRPSDHARDGARIRLGAAGRGFGGRRRLGTPRGLVSAVRSRERRPACAAPSAAQRLAKLEAELPNMLAALSWALDTSGARSWPCNWLSDWGDYWWTTNRWQEGRAWLDATLELPPALPIMLVPVRCSTARGSPMPILLDADRDDMKRAWVSFGRATTRRDRCLPGASGVGGGLARPLRARGALGDEATRIAGTPRMRQSLRPRWGGARWRGRTTPHARRARHRDRAPAGGRRPQRRRTFAALSYMATVQRRYQDALGWLEPASALRTLAVRNALFMLQTNRALAMLFLDELDDAARRSVTRSRPAAKRGPTTWSTRPCWDSPRWRVRAATSTGCEAGRSSPATRPPSAASRRTRLVRLLEFLNRRGSAWDRKAGIAPPAKGQR